MLNPQYDDKLIKEGMTGLVIKYVTEKGFGFIKADDKAVKDDIFVYFNQIVPANGKSEKEFLKLHQYQEVTFDLYSSRRGLVAKRVVAGEILTDLLISQVNNETK